MIMMWNSQEIVKAENVGLKNIYEKTGERWITCCKGKERHFGNIPTFEIDAEKAELFPYLILLAIR